MCQSRADPRFSRWRDIYFDVCFVSGEYSVGGKYFVGGETAMPASGRGNGDRTPRNQTLQATTDAAGSLKRDLFAVAKRHGKRAVRDAARGDLTQDEQSPDGDVPPEELNYPDEDVWTLPPTPEDKEVDGEDANEEHELSDAAKKVVDRLMDRLKQNAER